MRSSSIRALAVCALVFVPTLVPRADTSVQTLPFSQNWSNTGLITVDDDWSGVAGIVGYRGDGMTGGTGVNPQTVVAEGTNVADVTANHTNPNTFTTGGVAEFHIADPVIALQGSGTARAPHIVVTVNTTGSSNVHVAYNLRDIDGSADNAVQPVALQFRVGLSGNYTNVPAAFVADASLGGTATLVTPVGVDLPAAAANQPVVQIRIITTDAVGSDEWIGIDDLTITGTGSPVDVAPVVTSTTPANGATGVSVEANLVVNFSESVHATAGAFALECPSGAPQGFAQTASPAATFTLTPASPLPYSTTCVVTISAAEITEADSNDPPDPMEENYTFSFTTAGPPQPAASNIIINEVDSDTPGSDTAEFVELYDGGVGNTPLNGLVVVFYNGSNDLSYAAFDLDGFFTDANGYFTLGNAGVIEADLVFGGNLLQNGADAVALYASDASGFPNGTAVTTANLRDALVYDTDDSDDAGLLALLNAGQPQADEGGSGIGDSKSIQRCPNGAGGARNTASYAQGTPTPGAANACVPPPPPSNSVIVISQVYGGGGNGGATYENDYVELFNRGAATVDISGWSLQYASASGDGWAFTLQPLGGTIGPGQYYLIALASGGDDGAALPPANIHGQFNMSATNGKIALVNSFDGLLGNCPIADPSVMDFVGYGSADCREGSTTAPAGSNTTALFRLNNGSTDTDRNHSDFVAGPPVPRQTAPVVELGPLVLTTDPRANSSTAPRDATIAVNFTEPVDVSGAWFDITCAVTGQHNSATFGASGQAHYITPNAGFQPGELCTVTIFKDQVSDRDTDDSAPDTDTLPANHVWSFTVATGTAPPYSADVHLTMGNPSGAIASATQPNDYLMEKPEFALSYNRDFGRPNWVSWHLSDEWVGTLFRVDTFRADPAVPADWYRVQGFDFTDSGFDRGHLVPNADRDKETSIPINQATFLMTNMLAQAPDNNQGPWAALENDLRALLPTNEIYIVAGGVGTGGIGGNGFALTVADGRVTVPSETWKVALVIPKNSGDDVSRVSCSTRTIAVIMPNTQGIRTTPWQNFLVTVDAVETLTGYNFFSNLPAPYQRCVEAGINGDNPPLVKGEQTIAFAALADRPYTDPPFTVSATGGPSGNPVTFTASGSCTSSGANGATITLEALGACTITASQAGTAIYEAAPDVSRTFAVVDAIAPVISTVTTTPDGLGPPNHKMIDVIVGYTATDFSGAPVCALSVSSNEPANGAGDGNTSVDWQVVDAHHVRLRAERAGGGTGRIYTITVSCTDGSGNASTAAASVTVAK